MSWSGFKKNVGRATTQVMMKTGHVEKTSDREYEVEERRYRVLESASLRLQKEAKSYLDSLRAMTASQMRIAETIDAFYGDSGASDGVSRSYKQAVEDLDAETIKALDGPYRCVPSDLRQHFWNGESAQFKRVELDRIERQMNVKKSDTPIAQIMAQHREYQKLIDLMYRQTVLEPINRFCAYFPDINECIKKRNHKLLDYDALRSKVKKLTEKPDKDASKLPRTEKELEMVSIQDFLARTSPKSSRRTPLARTNIHRYSSTPSLSTIERGPLAELDFPSPPRPTTPAAKRYSNNPELEKATPSLSTPIARSISTSVLDKQSTQKEQQLQLYGAKGPPQPGLETILESPVAKHPAMKENDSFSSSEASTARPEWPSFDLTRTFSGDAASLASWSSITVGESASENVHSTSRRAASNLVQTSAFARPTLARTPFFNPSELEDFMQPLRQEFLQANTDKLAQAKASYDQLNDQLTSELPQLIDLRVPYLDPSFEALVKIQLRFCAEAYSRMAQVQQYLDATTRDQYASGDLDARVEDVLGQIRELSIAGTV